MDDDPWISWKMAQIDDELHLNEAVTRKAERSDCDTKAMLSPCVSFFFSAAVGSDGVRARPKPAEFPLLRRVPLTSAVSEILDFWILESIEMRFIARGGVGEEAAEMWR